MATQRHDEFARLPQGGRRCPLHDNLVGQSAGAVTFITAGLTRTDAGFGVQTEAVRSANRASARDDGWRVARKQPAKMVREREALLQLLLGSTAEEVYGIDLHDN